MNINQDSALMRGVRTAIQAAAGLVVGLAATVWAVPGVPAAVQSYLASNAIQLALMVGIPSGLVALVWNLLRKDVPNV